MISKKYILPALLFAGLLTAANVVITKYIVNQAVSSIYLPEVPKVVAVNINQIVEDKMKEGMTAVQIMTFTDTLMQVLLSDGYIILDSASIVNAPDKHFLKKVSTEQLAQMVEVKGIKIKDSKTFEDALKDSEEEFVKFVANKD